MATRFAGVFAGVAIRHFLSGRFPLTRLVSAYAGIAFRANRWRLRLRRGRYETALSALFWLASRRNPV
jgi:hypothetical protein